jgi:hypothetical protein
MTIKEDLYRLVDELPESELHAAKRYLEYLRNMGDPPASRPYGSSLR